MVEKGAEPLDPIEGGDLLGVFAGVFRFPETCDVRRHVATNTASPSNNALGKLDVAQQTCI